MMRPVLLWFRRNLRLSDNAALIAAAESGRPVIPLYVFDEQDSGNAGRWWLHHSLANLDRDLQGLGSSLVVRSGSPRDVLSDIAEQSGAQALYYARRYEPASRHQEEEVHAELGARMHIGAFDDGLLHHPDAVKTKNGTPYRIFTPFWKASAGQGEPQPPLPAPESIRVVDTALESSSLRRPDLLSLSPDRSRGFQDSWEPGEAGGLKRIDDLESTLGNYADHRDRPDIDGTSRLSPHLHFGEVSVRQIWQAVRQLEVPLQATTGSEALLRQMYWREFSTYLLFHFPDLPAKPLRHQFENFPWSKNESLLQAWQRGKTGYPIVDAGMRELRQTGWMHNRARMIVASFLVKDLLIPWQTGAAWFLDNLVDADLANNSAGWQWVAGCGSDTAPFFRIFNPTLQGKKFDPDGSYVRQWVPEIGETGYPAPIVNHGSARQRALEAYQSIKGI